MEPQDTVEVQSMSPASAREKDDTKQSQEALLERILTKDNLNRAYKRVVSNGGSPGVDGMTVDELLPYLKTHGEDIRQRLASGVYRPQPVRRVTIPKPDGGARQLGIPTVLDRFVQQAVAQILGEVFEPGFSNQSFGFRPGRSAYQAVHAARGHIEEGFDWAVDLDIERFFDRVNHDKLMALIARKVKDKRVLKLIRAYLESGVMLQGVKVKSEEGTPQGGPLSPLLANIYLDELDKELERRGHRFVRYADDVNVYVRSKKAAERTLQSITAFLKRRLKLKVNQAKSAADRPSKRKFLGISLCTQKGKVRTFVHRKSIARFKAKVREITSRSNGMSMPWRIVKLNQLIMGWVNYFRIADMRYIARILDGWIRRRLRMCFWKQWKRIKTRHDNLAKLGIKKSKAWEFANTRKGYWHTAGSYILSTSLTNAYLEKLGLVSLTKRLSLTC